MLLGWTDDTVVKAWVIFIGYDHFLRPGDLRHDIGVVQVVAQTGDVVRGSQGGPWDDLTLAVQGMHEAVHDLYGVGFLMDQGQHEAAKDSSPDDLAGNGLQNHFEIKGGEHEMPDGAKCGKQLQRFVKSVRLFA